jgi:hypothetical protein
MPSWAANASERSRRYSREMWNAQRIADLLATDGKFNSAERLDKLRAKEASLRSLGLHVEANTFKRKIAELSGGAFNSSEHPRDPEGKFATSGSTARTSRPATGNRPQRGPYAPPKPAASANASANASALHDTLKSKGFEKEETNWINNPDPTRRYHAEHRDGKHTVTINKETGQWKHYYPDGESRSTGVGEESLKRNLRDFPPGKPRASSEPLF